MVPSNILEIPTNFQLHRTSMKNGIGDIAVYTFLANGAYGGCGGRKLGLPGYL